MKDDLRTRIKSLENPTLEGRGKGGRVIADLLAQIFDHADEDSIIKTYWTGKNFTGGASNS